MAAIEETEFPAVAASFADAELQGLKESTFKRFDSISDQKPVFVGGLKQVLLKSQLPASLSKYVVGVYDKESKKLTLAPSAHLHFSSRPKSLPRFKSSQIALKNTLARNSLGQTFGTIKKKQSIKALEKNKVTGKSLSGLEHILQSTIDSSISALPSSLDVIEDVDRARPIPPFNFEAAVPSLVYNINDIISPSDFSCIQTDHIRGIQYKEDLSAELNKIYTSSYVFDRIFTELSNESRASQIKKYLYILYLMKLFTIKDQQLNKERVLSGVPPQIINSFFAMFTETIVENKNGAGVELYACPPRMRDKILGYLVCLCLMTSDYKIDFGVLAKDLKTSSMKMGNICKELGCRVENKKINGVLTKSAILVTPLKFPEPLKKNKRG